MPAVVRTAANGGEQFVNGGAQPLRHLIEEILGEKDVGVAKRDFFEGGDAEGVLCADPDAGRHEDQQRAGEGAFVFAAVAQLDQLGAADPHVVQRPVRREVVAGAEQADRGVGAESTAQPTHQWGSEFRLDLSNPHAMPGAAPADELGQLGNENAFEGLPQILGGGLG